MRISTCLFGSIAVLAAAACTSREATAGGQPDAGGPVSEPNGDGDQNMGGGSGGSNTGIASACGKGAWPDEDFNSTYNFCPTGETDNCLPLSDAKGYTAFPGEMYVHDERDLSDLSCMISAANLTIAEVASFKGLESLTRVGSLNIVDNNVPNLEGLDGLQTVEELYFKANGFSDLRGLPAGLTVTALLIDYSEELTSLAGLENITVTEEIAIQRTSIPKCEVDALVARFPGLKYVTNKDNVGTGTCD